MRITIERAKNLQPGAKLRCIDPGYHLTKGEIYTFKKLYTIGGVYINIKEHYNSFHRTRFEIIRPEIIDEGEDE